MSPIGSGRVGSYSRTATVRANVPGSSQASKGVAERQEVEHVVDVHVGDDDRVQGPEVGVAPELRQGTGTEVEDEPGVARLDQVA